MIVLDTNVLSELMKAEPNAAVLHAVDTFDQRTMFTTSISVAEIALGIARLPAGQRRSSLAAAAEHMFNLFDDRILPFDMASALSYASICSKQAALGKSISAFDAMIAAICQCAGGDLLTRNTRYFDGLGIVVIDPWVHK